MKKYLDKYPFLYLPIAYIGWLAYKKVSSEIQAQKAITLYGTGSGTSTNGAPLNLHSVVVDVWNEIYASILFVDRDKVLESLRSVPIVRFREFNSRYISYLTANKKNRPFSLNYFTPYGPKLQDDVMRVLSSKEYEKIKPLFASL